MTLYMDAAIGEAVNALKEKKMYASWQHLKDIETSKAQRQKASPGLLCTLHPSVV